MTLEMTRIGLTPPIHWPPDQRLVHESRDHVISAARDILTLTDYSICRDLRKSGWHRLSAPTTRRIREQHPEAGLVCAIYDVADLHRPGMPLATNGGYWFDAAEHANYRGDAVVVSVAADGKVEGLYVPPTVTVESLLRAARCSSTDTWRIVAALAEMLVLRDTPFRFSPTETARLRQGHDPAEPVYLLYDWRNLVEPLQVYSKQSFEWAERRAQRYDHLLVGLQPDGNVYGIESGPGRDTSFADVLRELLRRTKDVPGAGTLAVLGALLQMWHDINSCEETTDLPTDIRLRDVAGDDLLVEVRRRYAAACRDADDCNLRQTIADDDVPF